MIIYRELLTAPPTTLAANARVNVAYLTFDERKRGRIKLTTTSGESAGIQIERGNILRDNTWLISGPGEYLNIRAQKESVTTAYIDDNYLFARACYHLGNRHVQLQIGEMFLRYQNDYVLDEMLQGLGVEVTHEDAIFEPENGAYHAPHSHSHSNQTYQDHSHQDHQRDEHDHGHRH